MNKKQEKRKTIQLALSIAIAVVSLIVIFTDQELYQAIGHNASVRVLCIFLWLAQVLSFVSIFFDFREIANNNRNYRELNFSVRNDAVSGIANRFSCDELIEKYADKPLPESIGCVMLEISNLREINSAYGHTAGNTAIQQFSDLLTAASKNLCFVGRNGGNKFMALFEECSEEKMNTFLSVISKKMEEHNLEDGVPRIEYRSGRAFREDRSITSITQLISLADRRVTGSTDVVTGIPNRSGCVDVISQYFDKPLPPDVGCVMIDFVNLMDINENCGRIEGNRAIRRLSDAVMEASRGLCFAGRNSGTTFLALFDPCSEEKLASFTGKLKELVDRQNENRDQPKIRFSWGIAFHESGATAINHLLAAANTRIHDHNNI